MGHYARMSLHEAHQLVNERDPVVADIRDPQAFAQARIPGSIRLTNDNLAEFMAEQDPGQPVLVLCYHGVSSQNAGQVLANQGFAEVYSLDGGMAAWEQSYPDQVERGS